MIPALIVFGGVAAMFWLSYSGYKRLEDERERRRTPWWYE